MTYTLLADGTSDRVLVPILNWLLQQRFGVDRISAQWADLARIPRQFRGEMRFRKVLDIYPCDVLFVHRDAETQSIESRRREIAAAMDWSSVPHVPVIPVRMTEAWLLTDEAAIRCAAGNPHGTADLKLPDCRRLEHVPNPKELLYMALETASGLNARRRLRLRVDEQVHRIPVYIDDYSRLDALPAFRELQQDVRRTLAALAGR